MQISGILLKNCINFEKRFKFFFKGFILFRFKELFAKNSFFKDSLEFVDQVGELFDILIEYRLIHANNTSYGLKAFYLNELMVYF